MTRPIVTRGQMQPTRVDSPQRPKKHNRKRNSALVFEQLLARASSCAVGGDESGCERALDVVSRRFERGTELHRELRIARALVVARADGRDVAASILREARVAVQTQPTDALEAEKSALVAEINKTFGRDFYEARVPEYKLLATVQTLFEDWRNPARANIVRAVEYEAKLIDHLTRAPDDQDRESVCETHPGLFKQMVRRFNERWSHALDGAQARAVSLHVSGKRDELLTEMTSTRQRVLESARAKCDAQLLEKVERAIDAAAHMEKTDDGILAHMLCLELEGEIVGQN